MSPRRIDEDFFERAARFEERQRQWREHWDRQPREPSAGEEAVKTFYAEWEELAARRRQELNDLAKAQTEPMEKEIAELEARKRNARETLTKEFNERADVVKARERRRELESERDKLRNEMRERIKELRDNVAAAGRRAGLLHNADEYNAMPQVWKIDRPFARRDGNPFPGDDSLHTASRAYIAQQAQWVTRGDWDGRLGFEKSRPFDQLLPHQQRWLKRVKPYRYK